ncbi:family 20 glycosylhydrolase [Mucilaginibacter ginsenosidivorans]|uniref:beta-N-acetylhexosaminidase n=1 Tax=Mucilaginibacter ginsenosidivorans TaxID=398053 RepID=A0A5B8V0E6_9SPHI|nr:family 20 glycosylhydrolase [Mucilaginibacter ginsenosidivorans]QEC64101.1 family 20 glycosylhydrolase [Mucilaginibacter ginsenosidivorans]
MKNTINTIILLILCTIFGASEITHAQSVGAKYDLIPYPQSLIPGTGAFRATPATTIIRGDHDRFASEVNQLNNLFIKAFGTPLKKTSNKTNANAIEIKYNPTLEGPEGYTLTITGKMITISAKESVGIYRAIETIRQLLPAEIENKSGKKTKSVILPALSITDYAAYSWRGMHLDVSRHFFSMSYLKKFIDIMALYKMNKLHLHLTDDQGWRIEIKKYPKLTEQGAWRTFDKNDSACMKRSKDNPDFAIDTEHIIHKDGKTLYGGFYTQQQMKGLVVYAAARHIDIIPEIDMPGHMMAAITAYPFLTCNGENKFGELFSKPICPCNESTFEFAENVFSEIMDIFPSKYIHIGGDEVDRSDWAKSDACKALMQREGIKDLPALQSYFINRMEKFFNSKGRKLIGWDEVIEGGISPTALIMYWRGWVPDAPVKAVKNGNTVIMAPGEPLYFDNQPDQYSLYKIYHFNPIPAKLNEQEAKNIIGAQAELWSENLPSEKRTDYMYMPRMTALSELLWTNKQGNYDSYVERLQLNYKRLDVLNVHYRLPDLPGIINENVFTDADTLTIKKPLPQMRIFYTTDGTLPKTSSQELKAALIIKQSKVIKLAAFMPNGLRGDIYTLNYKKQEYAPAIQLNNPKPGLICNYYKAFFKQTSLISAAKSDSTFDTNTITVPATVKAPSFAITYRGYIDIPANGVYSFYLTCDDGGVLKIANCTVVDNDGLHSAIEKNGQVALSKGLQPFVLDFIEGGGGFTLKLKYSINGSEPKEVPSDWFKN